MHSIVTLWLPILVSAVIVFVVSSIIHMVLRYHSGDYRQLPSEDEVMDALRRFNIPPGDYMMPRAGGMAAMRDPKFMEKLNKGPKAMMTVMKSGPGNMGNSLLLWFLYSIVVGVLTAYICGHTMMPGATYLHVFRIAGATAFMGYAMALWQQPIWYGKSTVTTLKSTFDGLVYALMTAGTFGWLWPR
jgi:hypothetical protein